MQQAQKSVQNKAETKADWVPVSASESALLRVYCDKMGVELPLKQLEYKPSFPEQSSEAFDAELLRMAQAAQQEERDTGNERTLLDVHHYKRKAEEKLRQPGTRLTRLFERGDSR